MSSKRLVFFLSRQTPSSLDQIATYILVVHRQYCRSNPAYLHTHSPSNPTPIKHHTHTTLREQKQDKGIMPSNTLQKFSIAHYVLLALLLLITLAGAIPMFGLATTCTLTFILGTVLGSLYITSGIDFDQVSLFRPFFPYRVRSRMMFAWSETWLIDLWWGDA